MINSLCHTLQFRREMVGRGDDNLGSHRFREVVQFDVVSVRCRLIRFCLRGGHLGYGVEGAVEDVDTTIDG